MEFLMNNHKYGDRTLSDEAIEHQLDYSLKHEKNMQEFLREQQFNEADKKAIEESFRPFGR